MVETAQETTTDVLHQVGIGTEEMERYGHADKEEDGARKPVGHGMVGQEGGGESQQSQRHLDGRATQQSDGGMVVVAVARIDESDQQVEEGDERNADTGSRQSPQTKETDDGTDDHHRIDTLQQKVGPGVALGQGNILHGEFDGSEIHGNHHHLHHSKDRHKLVGIEQGKEDGQRKREGNQDGSSDQEHHFGLAVDSLRKRETAFADATETGKIVSLHGREYHADIGHRHHVARIIEAHGVDLRHIVEVTADEEVGQRTEHACQDKGHAEPHHTHTTPQDATGEREAKRIEMVGVADSEQKLGEGHQHDGWDDGRILEEIIERNGKQKSEKNIPN